MHRPETAGELMQFLQAVNWLRTSLPRMAEVVEPLRLDHMAENPRRTKRGSYPREVYAVLMFPDAPDEYWSSFFTQV